MKFNGVLSAATVLAVLSSPALAKPLQEAEKKFLMEVLKAGAIATHCPGFAFIEKSTIRLGDRYGVDGASLTDAINEALRLIKMENYDRRKLIPEVTEEVENLRNIYIRAMEVHREAVCTGGSETSLYLGLVRRTTASQ